MPNADISKGSKIYIVNSHDVFVKDEIYEIQSVSLGELTVVLLERAPNSTNMAGSAWSLSRATNCWAILDRDSRLEILKRRKVYYNKHLTALTETIRTLELFDSDEEEMASKLFEAVGLTADKDKIKEAAKKLKESNARVLFS